jgi:hypothetical protein
MENEQGKKTQNTSSGAGNKSTDFSSTNLSSPGLNDTSDLGGTNSATSDLGGGEFGNAGTVNSDFSGTGSSTTGSSMPGSSTTGISGAVSGSGSESGSDLSVDSVKETARGLYDQAKSTAGQAFGTATQRATEVLDEKKGTVAVGLTSVADSIKQVGENLSTTDEPNPIAETAAKYSNSLAQQIENLSGYFERKDVREMMRDVETFARRNPAYFIGGAVALGFLAARFLKSSNPNRRGGYSGGSRRIFAEDYEPSRSLTTGSTTTGSMSGTTGSTSGTTPDTTPGSSQF